MTPTEHAKRVLALFEAVNPPERWVLERLIAEEFETTVDVLRVVSQALLLRADKCYWCGAYATCITNSYVKYCALHAPPYAVQFTDGRAINLALEAVGK